MKMFFTQFVKYGSILNKGEGRKEICLYSYLPTLTPCQQSQFNRKQCILSPFYVYIVHLVHVSIFLTLALLLSAVCNMSTPFVNSWSEPTDRKGNRLRPDN